MKNPSKPQNHQPLEERRRRVAESVGLLLARHWLASQSDEPMQPAAVTEVHQQQGGGNVEIA